MSRLGVGSFHRDRPIPVVVLHVSHGSKRDAGGGDEWVKKGSLSVAQLWSNPL